MSKEKIALFIGRFAPPHRGHLESLLKTMKADKYIVAFGSAGGQRTSRTPWTYSERVMMMEGSLIELGYDPLRFSFIPLIDHPSNTAWRDNVVELAHNACRDSFLLNDGMYDISLIGHRKDETSFYLDLFPEFEFVNSPVDTEVGLHSATTIREAYFQKEPDYGTIVSLTTVSVVRTLQAMQKRGFNERTFD